MKKDSQGFIQYDENRYAAQDGDLVSPFGVTNRYRLSLFLDDVDKNWKNFLNGQSRYARTMNGHRGFVYEENSVHSVGVPYRGVPLDYSLGLRLSSCSDMANEMHISKSGQSWEI